MKNSGLVIIILSALSCGVTGNHENNENIQTISESQSMELKAGQESIDLNKHELSIEKFREIFSSPTQTIVFKNTFSRENASSNRAELSRSIPMNSIRNSLSAQFYEINPESKYYFFTYYDLRISLSGKMTQRIIEVTKEGDVFDYNTRRSRVNLIVTEDSLEFGSIEGYVSKYSDYYKFNLERKIGNDPIEGIWMTKELPRIVFQEGDAQALRTFRASVVKATLSDKIIGIMTLPNGYLSYYFDGSILIWNNDNNILGYFLPTRVAGDVQMIDGARTLFLLSNIVETEVYVSEHQLSYYTSNFYKEINEDNYFRALDEISVNGSLYGYLLKRDQRPIIQFTQDAVDALWGPAFQDVTIIH